MSAPKSSIPNILLQHLKKLEPDGQFSGHLPKVRSETSGKLYYCKLGSTSEKDQFIGEAESLKEMENAAPGLVPKVLALGVIDSSGKEVDLEQKGKPYMISQYRELSGMSSKVAATLGRRLATELHTYQSSYGYGFGVPTYCGKTRLENGWFKTWDECYSAKIGELLAQLRAKGQFLELCDQGEEVRERVIPWLLGSLEIKPVILHGDLWSGNLGTDVETGEPFIFDPASFFGHNEFELAIGRMFGGISRTYYEAYHEVLAESDPIGQYELRADLYILFHYLNHTLLFGSSYAGRSETIMSRLLRSVPDEAEE